MTNLRSLLLLAACSVTLAAACLGGGTTPNNEDTAAAPAPTPTRTGLAPADQLVRLVEARDVLSLVARIAYTGMNCTDQIVGAPAPPRCSPLGLPEGAVVEVLPYTISATEYLPPARVQPVLTEILQDFAVQFHGVFRPGPILGVPRPDYAVVFRPTMTPPGRPTDLRFAFYVLGDKIIAIQAFGTGAATLPPAGDPSWLVGPLP